MAGLFVTDITPEQVENARKWIDALRSGQYEQGCGVLRPTENTFCCLGVGCDVLGVNWRLLPTGIGTLLPPHRDSLGLVDDLGGLDIAEAKYEYNSLADLNDTWEWSFTRIADVIEAELALVVEVPA